MNQRALVKRLRWFDEGAPMFRVVAGRLGMGDVLPANEEFYACPSCLMAYNRAAVIAGVLTEEHVPPKALGGRSMLLTCTQCNSISGSSFDAHAANRLDAEEFMRGTANGRVLPATFHVDGIPLRGTAQWTVDGLQLFGVPRQNDPRVQAAHLQALNAYVDSGHPNPPISFTVHTRFDEARARLSWIRAAYLAAFTALGWSYILREVMEPFRDQLRQPDAKIIPTYMLRSSSDATAERRILLVEHPDELRCVAVIFGELSVFLPGIFRPLNCEQLADAFGRCRDANDQLQVSLQGKEMPWPQWPTYFLDGPAE
ncbi:HNH endonuclease [Herbidospora yilanensis]|uniref:HNH endonuclease n=1 Tax=Herbidospora yilanensis TaxID=354426 RepID=UPI0018DE5D1E|nr:HNH endonuclease [Herbidospora yilanensis]